MKNRCFYESASSYEYYGARGIAVCDEWLDFASFAEWAAKSGYADGLQIDRVDCDGNYTPANCRWVTREKNMRNTRGVKIVAVNGEPMCISEAAELCGVSSGAIYSRIYKGASPQQAVDWYLK